MTTNDIYPDAFNGYPDFRNVRDPILRAWNRINVIFNMKEILHNNVMSMNYVKQFGRDDQTAIAKMAIRITKFGYENVRREIIRNRNAR